MIQPQELRIGNTINVNGRIENVTLLTLGAVMSGIDKCSPIPLTEEILLKFGFDKVFLTNPQDFNPLSKYTSTKDKDFYLLKFDEQDVFFYSSGNGMHYDISSIHQLQNLYYSLTWKELIGHFKK